MPKGFEYRKDAGVAVDMGDVLTTTITGLTANTSYNIEVRKRDDAGNFSAWSPVVAQTTLAGGGGSGNVTWTNLLNADGTAPDLFRSSAYYSRASSTQLLNAGSSTAVYYECQPPAGTTSLGGSYTSLYLVPDGTYTSTTPGALASVTGQAVRISGNFHFAVYDASNAYVSDTDPVADTDVFRVGFDGTGKARVWKNGTTFWTSTPTYSGDYLLYVVFNAEGGTNKIRNVTYQQ